MYYVNCFLVYSFFGYLYETIVSHITKRKFNSGILYTPFTPIYGFGVVLILLISKYFFINLHLPKIFEISIILIILMFCLTLLEFIGGILIEKTCGVVYWDYSRFKFHIGHYIALEITLLWGFLSLILIYIVHPLLTDFISMIPKFITISLIIIIIIDLIFSVMHLKKII